MVEEITHTKNNKQYAVNEDKYDISKNSNSKEDTKCDIFTTVVRMRGSGYNVVPVKSSKPLDKSLWIECSKVLARIHVGPPTKIGDIICKNILNTKVDIICTKNINKVTK